MDYEQRDKVEELKKFLSTYVKPRQDRHKDIKAIEADLLWDAGRFWATVVYRAQATETGKTIHAFNEFTKEYNKRTGKRIDTESLFCKYWLRNVVGYVHVASAISFSVHSFEELKGFRHELQFVSEFYQERSKRQQIKVSKVKVEAAAFKYEKKYSLTLNREGIFFQRWARVIEGEVEFSAMDIYFDPLLGNWDEFEFLNDWKNHCNDGRFAITDEAMKKIWETFGHFKQLPDLKTFEDQNVIKKNENIYYLNFYGSEPSYWTSLQDKIGGYLWEYMVSDNEYNDDNERVIAWLTKGLAGNSWPNPLNYVTQQGKERFLNATLKLLQEEKDVEGLENEFEKLRLDSPEYRGAEVLNTPANHFENYKLNNNNLYELYRSMHRLEEESQITYLHKQPARSWLTFLITTVVEHDDEYCRHHDEEVPATHYFARINTLLRQGNERPFFLWKTSNAIIYHRPAILPYLLIEPHFCGLALCLSDELEFISDLQSQLLEVWTKSVNLLLLSLPHFKENEEIYVNVIFQVYRQLNDKKYGIPHKQSGGQKKLQDRQVHEKREKEVLSLIENAPVFKGIIHGGPTLFILPEIFDKLVDKFLNFKEPSLFINGSIQFPMLNWDALFWLMKTTTNWQFRQFFAKHPEKPGRLADAFLLEYLQNLEQSEVVSYDYFEEKETKRVPLWSEKIERMELLEWIYPIYAINAKGKLTRFLEPRIDFENTEDRYHQKNRFNAEKLRTHIAVLLQILRKLILPSLPFGFEKAKLLQIKDRIETQVVEYVNQYSKDVLSEGRIDLFSYNSKWEFKQSEKEALLPQIAQAINWFTKKDDIINALLSTGDLVKLLTLLDYIAAEGVKKLLFEKIRATDLVAFLEGKTWIPEIQTTLVKISHYPELLHQTEQAVKYWKEKVISRRNDRDYKTRLYISELLVAYFKNDEEALNRVKEPGEFHGSMNDLNYRGYKDFYRGLLFMNEKPEKAVPIFDDLAKRYASYISIAQNRMAAKLRLGMERNEIGQYREAYEEWKEEAEKNFTQSELDSMEPELSSNLITILNVLGEHQKIDDIFNRLDLPTRMHSHILKARVNNLVAQKRIAEALNLVDSAKIYHQFAGNTAIGIIEELETIVSGEDDVDELSMYYHRIFTNPPPKLIRILPLAFNGKQDIHEFLVKEIVNAGDKLLEKIRSIDEIKSEDKFNDLIELVLDSRINALGLHVGAQGRGAYSDATDDTGIRQPGRRDLPILDSNQKVWLVCEALVYRGKSNAGPHLQKVFNYHHQRQAFAMLYYDNATRKKGFEGNWKEYVENILPNTVFPEDMEITCALADVSEDFNCQESAIKVGKSVHGANTIIYHIFVNINYELKTNDKV